MSSVEESTWPYPPFPKHTTTSYLLHYAATWQFAVNAPYQHLPVTLSFDPVAGVFLICQYQRPQKHWKLLGALDLANVHAYTCDRATRLRVLGWKDCDNRANMETYYDFQFVKTEDFDSFLKTLGCVRVENSKMQSSLDMIHIFRKVPEKPGDADFGLRFGYDIEYMPPSSRHYRTELARSGDVEVEYRPMPFKIGGEFDCWTTYNEQAVAQLTWELPGKRTNEEDEKEEPFLKGF
ncbi:hypothetical protein BDV95DRAFT_594697 [Massariosphaeria phaeospora]|uniref:Uncharacterized protein n=1 Tax=Massariosphaeria phaeospora TaxID=100035 RepID=A0A7C8MA85_9PLEO|nr:hypothetical protein BDV95DRAFT_594697 [Massariosphaeria phaeospora]